MALVALSMPAQVIDDYLCYWSFDEASGDVAHDVGTNGFDGAISGATWVEGIAGRALEFDGVDDVVVVSDGDGYPDLIGSLTEGTISVWFKFDTVPGANEIYPFFYLGDGGGPDPSSLIIEVGHLTPQSRLYFTITVNGQVELCFDSEYHLDPGRWHHFAAVVGPDFNTGYLEGEEMIDRDYNYGGPEDHQFFSDLPNKRACRIGRGSHQTADAVIDEIRIYDRPLSAHEILAYYESVTAPLGDLDGDGLVSTGDLLMLLGMWGACDSDCPADLNGDRVVGTADLLLLLRNWS
jgi:hypothetical protein